MTCCLRSSWRSTLASVSIEPILFLHVIATSLTSVSIENIYMAKACQVNLNHSAAICSSIYDHEAIQQETQHYVAEVRAYSKMVQALPGLLFALAAGPLSDRYGRRPLLIISLTGYVCLDLVFLINSLWFEELSVEYLMIESIQDFIGGDTCFYLAMYTYIADITTVQQRTKRLAILESFIPLGALVGLPLGPIIRETLGFVALFAISTTLSCLNVLVVLIFIADTRHRADFNSVVSSAEESQALQAEGTAEPSRGGGACIIFNSVRTLAKWRPHGGRTWILAILMIFTVSSIIETGDESLWYMFFQLKYKTTDAVYSYLDTYFVIIWFFSQLLVIPWLSSGPLKLPDMVILMVGSVLSTAGALIIMLGTEFWHLFLSYSMYILYVNMSSLCRSSMTKMVKNDEVGSALSLLGMIKAVLPLGVAPLYGFLYQATLSFYPPMFLVISLAGYQIILVVAALTQRGLVKRSQPIAKLLPSP